MITDSDIKALFRACTSQTSSSSPTTLEVPSPPPYFELLSGIGIILESSAKEEIEKRIVCSGGDEWPRTSIVQLASELSLESRTIEKLLPYHREGWGRIGASTIVTTGEFKRLQEDLVKELGGRVVQVPEFLRRNEIDPDLFRKLLPPVAGGSTWQWLGHDRTWIVGTAFYEVRERDVEKLLIDAKRPTDISALLADSNLPLVFLTRVVSALVKLRVLKGTIEGSYYIPEIYVAHRQAMTLEDLCRDGLIAIETLRKEGIESPEDFIRDKIPSARLLGIHFVTADFIANVEGLVLDEIERQMWSDMKAGYPLYRDLDLRLGAADEKALRQVIMGDLPELREVANKIVSKDLESMLAESSRGFAVKQAEVAWRKGAKERLSGASFRSQELLKHLSVMNPSLPMAILSHLVNAIYPRTSLVFSTHLRELKDSEIRAAKSLFVEKCYVRFYLHQVGLEALVDAPLKAKLAADLLEYARGMVTSALDKLESVFLLDNDNMLDLQQLRLLLKAEATRPQLALQEIKDGLIKLVQQDLAFDLPSRENLEKKKRGMVDEMQTQLENTGDPSLMLLLAIIILHSSKTPGVLKATGKYVPKLLKDLGKRQQIAKTDLEVLNSVKDAVVGKKEVGEGEAEQLRQIAKRCLAEN